jgi:SAM-dependent methyltransferase
VDAEEIRRSAALEQRHWWYAGRRGLVRRLLADRAPGVAVDVGCGSGGNSDVLRSLGWRVLGIDSSPTAVELAAARRLPVVRADARRLPLPDASVDLVLSTDAWEHVAEDDAVAAEAFRVLRPGGRALVTVPAGTDLWSGHDLALGHERRYERAELVALVERAGLRVDRVLGWNVLLRPVARLRRRRLTACRSEMEPVNPVLNLALKAVVALEARLPVQHRRGVSLVVLATRPEHR